MNEELVEEIWVSSNYEMVFCTKDEKENYLRFLSSRSEIPRGMSIVFISKKISKQYTKNEIMNASPEQLKKMIK